MKKVLTLSEATSFVFAHSNKEIADRTGETINNVGVMRFRRKHNELSIERRRKICILFGFVETSEFQFILN